MGLVEAHGALVLSILAWMRDLEVEYGVEILKVGDWSPCENMAWRLVEEGPLMNDRMEVSLSLDLTLMIVELAYCGSRMFPS